MLAPPPAAQPSLGPKSLKRKASTSAPSSPTNLQTARKRSDLTRVSSNDSPDLLPELRPGNSGLDPLAFDEESRLSLGGASERSTSMSSISTDSSLSSASKAWAPEAHTAQDTLDAKRVLQTIKQIMEGTYEVENDGPDGKYLIHRRLHLSGYKLLKEVELQKEENLKLLEIFKGDKLRFDYTCRPYEGDKHFVIHMSSAFHTTMAGQFSDMIVRWLCEIQLGLLCTASTSKESTMKHAKRIGSTLGTTVHSEEDLYDRLEPVLSYTHNDCLRADLVVEISWSQRQLRLADRATRYIKGTGGKIRTVVGLDMNDIYHGGRRATFSVWKAQKDGDQWNRTTRVENVEFIDGNGQAVPECELSLSLSDFISPKMASRYGDFEDVPLHISSTDLHCFYKLALLRHVADEADDEMNDIEKRVTAVSEKILSVERTIQGRVKIDTSGSKVMETKPLADIRALLVTLEDEFEKMQSMMEGVKEIMGKVDQKEEMMEGVEKARVELASKVAELGTRLANARAEEGSITVERSTRSRVRSAFRRSARD
ncbi:hypothetical protein F5Y07DRAFT_360277 [Xylaria sp. FL0933]|nr:hypothetical protein F5Y07DRAFT_360277 [Xylaria sp. FL0933]